jgi:hypothetical protein
VLTVGPSFVIKFDFAGQLFATEYEPPGKRKRLKYQQWYAILIPDRSTGSALRKKA